MANKIDAPTLRLVFWCIKRWRIVLVKMSIWLFRYNNVPVYEQEVLATK